VAGTGPVGRLRTLHAATALSLSLSLVDRSLSPAVAVRSGAAAIGEIFRLQCRLLHCALSPRMRETVPPEFMHAPLIHVAFIVSGAPAGENIGLLASPGHWPRGGRGGCAGPGRSYAPQSAA
jgi:hypothetical protein